MGAGGTLKEEKVVKPAPDQKTMSSANMKDVDKKKKNENMNVPPTAPTTK
jgi:hypothetical protein